MEQLFIWAKRTWVLCFGALVVFMLYSSLHNSTCESVLTEQLELSFDGAVVAKRKPGLSHGSFYIDFVSQDDTLAYLVEKRGDEEKFWNSVPIGATVHKRAQSLSFTITERSGKTVRHSFHCNE